MAENCNICNSLIGPDESAALGYSEHMVLNAHVIYLIHAIKHWMERSGYDFGDEKKKKVPIHDGQLIDALSEILEYRKSEGGDMNYLMDGENRKMKNYWIRTGRKYDGEFDSGNGMK